MRTLRMPVAAALASLAFPVGAADFGTRPNPPGEGNVARSVSGGPRGEHRQGVRRCLVSKRFIPELRERVLESRFGTVPEFGGPWSGPIQLRDRGDPVALGTLSRHGLTGTRQPQSP